MIEFRGRPAAAFVVLAVLALLGGLLSATQVPALAAPAFKAPFPCNQSWAASTYGGHGSNDNAVDFNLYPGQSDLGQPALASAAGTATSYWDAYGGGNVVKIDHGGGWTTIYAHLGTVSVANPISRGEQIGTVGNTGSQSTSPHLHFEQRLDGVAQPVAFDGSRISVGRSADSSAPRTTSTNCGQASSGPPAEGSFVSYRGDVYRVVGGAPVYVSSWEHMGGPQPAPAIDDADFEALEQFPRDGTLISGQAPGAADHGTVYVVAGGAPVYVSSYANIGGDRGTTGVDLAAIHQAGSGGVWNHLRQQPVDGTFLRAGDRRFQVSRGAPYPTTAAGSSTTVDPRAIDNAGQPGVWSHLAAPVAPDTSGAPATPSRPPSSTAPPTAAPPASRPVSAVSVTARATKASSRLSIDVDPDSSSRDYAIVVQRRKSGRWVSVKTTTTQGARDTRVLDLKAGSYRVAVKAGSAVRYSKVVRLRR